MISEAKGNAQAVVIATGSEVELALEAQKVLAEQGIAVRVVSMPSTNVFDHQDAAYKAAVLPEGLPRVAVEAGHADGWYKYVGLNAPWSVSTASASLHLLTCCSKNSALP